MTRTRIRAAHVLAYDSASDDHCLLTDASVVIEESRIVEVGQGEGRAVDHEYDHDYDLGQALLMPGLIDLDAVADIDHALLDSWSETPLDWSGGYARSGRRHVFDADERRLVRRYALAQLVAHGITTAMPIAAETHSEWAESYEDLLAMAEEAETLGLRLFAGPSYRSGVNVIEADGSGSVHQEPGLGQAGLAGALRFIDWARVRGSELITGALLPCRIETLSEHLLRDTAAAAVDAGVKVRLHALQGLTERALIARRSGETPMRLMERLGVLGPDLLIPHAIYLDDDPAVVEFDRRHRLTPTGLQPGGPLSALAEHDVSIVHCPLTSARYGTVLRSFGRFRAAGVRVTLGTDSFPPDLVRGMDLGSNLAKIIDDRLDAAPVEDYVRAATLAGAAALGRPDLGRISVGATADLVAFSFADPREGVLDDPIRTLIMNGTARSAVFSMINGRVTMRDGQPTAVDLGELRDRAQLLFARMRDGYAERDGDQRAVGELFPPTFGPPTR